MIGWNIKKKNIELSSNSNHVCFVSLYIEYNRPWSTVLYHMATCIIGLTMEIFHSIGHICKLGRTQTEDTDSFHIPPWHRAYFMKSAYWMKIGSRLNGFDLNTDQKLFDICYMSEKITNYFDILVDFSDIYLIFLTCIFWMSDMDDFQTPIIRC